jgi:hypothetical protein
MKALLRNTLTPIALGTAASLVSTGSPAVAAYPPGASELAVSQSVVAAGKHIRLAGKGFRARSKVHLSLRNRKIHRTIRLGERSADASGRIRTNVVIPNAAMHHHWRLVAAGRGTSRAPMHLQARIIVR